jgi:alpha-L-fucosidase 2
MMLGNPACQKPYQPVGDLRLRFPHHERVGNYARSLDLDQAIATTTYQIGDGTSDARCSSWHPTRPWSCV